MLASARVPSWTRTPPGLVTRHWHVSPLPGPSRRPRPRRTQARVTLHCHCRRPDRNIWNLASGSVLYNTLGVLHLDSWYPTISSVDMRYRMSTYYIVVQTYDIVSHVHVLYDIVCIQYRSAGIRYRMSNIRYRRMPNHYIVYGFVYSFRTYDIPCHLVVRYRRFRTTIS